MAAINLYEVGISQESSDPRDVVKTLRKAQQESTAAITNGGGANSAVLHNDWLIGQAIIMAQESAAKTPGNPKATQATQNQGNPGSTAVGNSPTRPVTHHAQVRITVR